LRLDASYVSPAAKVAQQKANGLLSTMTIPDGLPSKAAEINAIENIVSRTMRIGKCSARLLARVTIHDSGMY
jgi:hypothetical protein